MVDPRRHLLLLLLLVLSFTPPSSLFHTLTQHTTCPFILTSLGGWGEEMQFSLMPRRDVLYISVLHCRVLLSTSTHVGHVTKLVCIHTVLVHAHVVYYIV